MTVHDPLAHQQPVGSKTISSSGRGDDDGFLARHATFIFVLHVCLLAIFSALLARVMITRLVVYLYTSIQSLARKIAGAPPLVDDRRHRKNE